MMAIPERCYVVCLALMFFLEQGTSQIPPGLSKYGSTSGCHGITSQETQMNATCPSGSVIAINDITLGAKPIDSGCPLFWNLTWDYDECCTKDPDDCNFPFYENKQYHELCNGDEQCISDTQFQEIHGDCDSYNGTFGGANGRYSSYMFMDFYCIQDDYIVEMCTTSSTTAESDTVYIWNDNFPTSAITTAVTSCECSVEIDNCESDIEVYKIYRNLAGNSDHSCEQNVTVYDSANDAVLQWNCDDNSLNFNMATVAETYITVELNNKMNKTGGRLWLGFRASMSSNITVNCPAKPREHCEASTTTTTTTSTTTTTTDTTTTPTTNSTTTTDQTTTTLSTTTNDSTTTTTTTTTDDPTEGPTTKVDSLEGTDKDKDLLTIFVIVLGVLCFILIVFIVILCICLIKRRDTNSTKDAESPLKTDKKGDEVYRISFRNANHDKLETVPPNVALNGVHNANIKVKTDDMACQTYAPVQSMTDAQCQADPPITLTNHASCQTEILDSKCVTKNKKIQVKFESMKIKTDDKDTMTEMNLVDIAVQTDKKIKHKNKIIKVSSNRVHPEDEEPEIDKPLQTVEDFVVEDVPVSHDSSPEQPKKRKKKKKKHDEKYEDDENHDRPVQQVVSYPAIEQDEEPESTDVVSPVKKFPVERKQTSFEISEDDDGEINYNLVDDFESNRIEKRYRRHRNAIQSAFYAPEREQLKFEKYYRKYGHKKRKKQKVSSEA